MLEKGDQRPARLALRYRTEVAAGGASVLSTLAAFPLDSVKTRMQTYQYNGVLDCIRHTYRTESLKGFFRGEFASSHFPFPRLRYDGCPGTW